MFYVGKRFIVKSCRVMWPQLASAAAAAAAFNLDPLPCSSGLWDIWYAGRGAGGGGDCVSSANVSFCFLSGLYYQYSYYYYCVSLAAAHVCVCESVKVCAEGTLMKVDGWGQWQTHLNSLCSSETQASVAPLPEPQWIPISAVSGPKGLEPICGEIFSLCASLFVAAPLHSFFFFSPRNPQSDHAWLPG